jgi:S-adenosylhomocysteine hydrolase
VIGDRRARFHCNRMPDSRGTTQAEDHNRFGCAVCVTDSNRTVFSALWAGENPMTAGTATIGNGCRTGARAGKRMKPKKVVEDV